MTDLLHDLVESAASSAPDNEAVVSPDSRVSYGSLQEQIEVMAGSLVAHGFLKHDRLAVYLPKQIETVISIFGTTLAGGIFVPVNPVLKSKQVGHILRDSGAAVLITTADRLASIGSELAHCPTVKLIVLTDSKNEVLTSVDSAKIMPWHDFFTAGKQRLHRVIDIDVAGLLYTSGSTGKPKGVVLSHRNFVAGARSVATYIENRASDRILAVLPLSFDAGFSQISTAFFARATVVLHNYIFAGDVVRISAQEKITGITAVPPLWQQIAEQNWPDASCDGIRYFANTGGKMPRPLLQRLREIFRNADPFLMYGLTEAFRSTYLPPSEVDRRPDSIGKAIPNAEILVAHDDGSRCGPNEPGELVHRGATVALGYWNSPEKTARRFRPFPASCPGLTDGEIAVWSGDTVRMDEDGFLYFIGRTDDMIKTSGYRVSPTEIEEAGFESGLVSEIAAIGISDNRLGQAIVVVATPVDTGNGDTEALRAHFQSSLPAFMVPAEIQWRDSLPKNANGKIDRHGLLQEMNEENRDNQE